MSGHRCHVGNVDGDRLPAQVVRTRGGGAEVDVLDQEVETRAPAAVEHGRVVADAPLDRRVPRTELFDESREQRVLAAGGVPRHDRQW